MRRMIQRCKTCSKQSEGWLSSVVYVSALSLWALVSGHWAAWQAARVEVKQEQDIQKRDGERPVENRVVDQLVAETEIERSPE